jgi:hypothetical protein
MPTAVSAFAVLSLMHINNVRRIRTRHPMNEPTKDF